MSRTRRALTARAYIRLWEYMSRRDREYTMCWFVTLHDRIVSRTQTSPGFIAAITRILGTLGLTGQISAGIVNALEGVRPNSVEQ